MARKPPPPKIAPEMPLFRIILAMSYRQCLLATTALRSPDLVRRLAASTSLIKQIKAAEVAAAQQKAA